MSTRERAHRRAHYPHIRTVGTRWMDNDAYGHVNNVVYYSFFDTAVNAWLIEQGVLDIERSPVIGLVVATECSYFRPLTFPESVSVGLRVEQLGHSSVRYGIGIFRAHDEEAAAQGRFTHVYVERASRRPAALPDALRQALERLQP